ncbi:MAG: pimeloyl-ACP methyl ester carboxylesterase [Paracoccaceae bacterium]|jgi:pimeloyl-ACP methyl ester carboxylesterase
MKMLSYIIVILAISVGFLWVIANKAETQAEEKTPPVGQFVNIDGQKIHVQVTGQGPPLVLIHGAGGNIQDMTFELAPAIIDRFTLIMFDRPGHGHTPILNQNGESLTDQATLISGAIRALGYEKVYVLGQSFGGSVALRMTLDAPDMVAGLVLVSAPSNQWESSLGTLYALTANRWSGPFMRLLIASVTPKSVITGSLEQIFEPQAVPQGYAEHIGVGLALRRSQQMANALQVRALKSQIGLMIPRYSEIAIPVEAIHGAVDTIVPKHIHTDILADQIADITVTTLDGVGHMPHHTHTNKVVVLIDRLHERVGLKPAE